MPFVDSATHVIDTVLPLSQTETYTHLSSAMKLYTLNWSLITFLKFSRNKEKKDLLSIVVIVFIFCPVFKRGEWNINTQTTN